MATTSLNGAFGVLSEADIIANELGVNKWQLTQGSYNGVVFHVVKSTLSRLNDTLNPAAGIVDSTMQLIGAPTSANGFSDNSNLPYGTTTVSTAMTTMAKRKLAIRDLPNNQDVFEDMGWNGDIHIIQGIIFGASYSQAHQNIMNVFVNDDNAYIGQKNVLVHPILGTIPTRVYLETYKEISNPNLWRSVMYEFVFRAAAPYATIKSYTNTITSGINSAISSVLAISTTLLSTWGDIYAIQTSYATSGNTYTIEQALADSQASVDDCVNTSVTTAKLMVNNLKPNGYNNTSLSQTTTTPTTEIPSYFYFINNMTPSDVNSILVNNNAIVQGTIETLQVLNDNVIYDSITNLLGLQAALIDLANVLLNSYYGNLKQYVTPYDMDLFTLCFLNNLDYATQSTTVYTLNQALIPSANYIPKNVTLNIPVSSNKAIRKSA